MKRFLTLVACFSLAPIILSGCGAVDRSVADLTGHSKVCVDGVTYLQFPSGVTPQYTISGQLISCK